jgi:phosphoribosyl 1,2-cyclic phosphodiesterase
MRATFWGTRGSLASAGPETARYGGDTACVEVSADDGAVLVLDAGSGIRRLGLRLMGATRIDVLLTHLHMDHIQGLGFFGPLFGSGASDVHLWGPPASSAGLAQRLGRYLSPPLFPVRVRDIPSLVLHDAPFEPTAIGPFTVTSAPVVHPGTTLGYRVEADGRSLAYLPDHEVALGCRSFAWTGRWTSGCGLAAGVDLLIHDAQYTTEEYGTRVGWGHSTVAHAIRLAELAGARTLAPFHHDPAHDDDELDALFASAAADLPDGARLEPARQGLSIAI